MTEQKPPASAGSQQGRDAQGRFEPGSSGNPKGRRHGSRNRATIAAQTLLEGEAERLTRTAIDMALDGDTTALSLCINRIIPPTRERHVSFELPEVSTPADVLRALDRIAQAVAGGEIDPAAGDRLGSLVTGWLRAHEATEMERRLTDLEERLKPKGDPDAKS